MTCPSMPGVAPVAILDCSVQRPMERSAASSPYRRRAKSTEREPAMAEGITPLQTQDGWGRREEAWKKAFTQLGESLMFIKSIGPQVAPACIFEHNKCVKTLHSL